MLDQRLLPGRIEWIEARSWQQVAEAIRDMALRGAPLIGIAAAYGYAMAVERGETEDAAAGLASTRPTAVNLFKALERVSASKHPLDEAHRIKSEEEIASASMATFGASLLSDESRVVTICNTGSLATAGIGTALGVVRRAHAEDKLSEAILLETRPRQQGLKLSAWELGQDDIPFRVIVDSAAAWLLATQGADFVVAGADRIARCGDSANKIGTYALALAALRHGVPFVVVAPDSTIDRSLESGASIPIEERCAAEVTESNGHRVAPMVCPVWNPAFDVTPADLISAIVTENGVFRPPYKF
jgi:methylthioribose-1-phosphate isomerase